MAKYSHSLTFMVLRTILSLLLLRVCSTTTLASYFNFDMSVAMTPTTMGFTITGETNGDYFGWPTTTAGDVDNDGYDDILVGAYANNNEYGAVYVIYGGPTSSFADVLLSTALNPLTTGFWVKGNNLADSFGTSIATAGDINNDGYDDIIIGAKTKNSNTGAVYVIYGGERSSLANIDLRTTNLNPTTNGFTLTGWGVNNYLGCSVSTAGDVNKDGYDDIVIGAYRYNTYTGAVYVVYGGPKASLPNRDFSQTALNPPTTGFTITGEAIQTYFSNSVSTAGDINHDGFSDIIIGAWKTSSSQGKVFVVYGRETSLISNIDLSSITLDPMTTGFTIKGEVAGDQFGITVTTAGDINNDGFDDIIIGANGKNTNTGAAYLIYGGEKSSLPNLDLSSDTLNPLSTGFIVTGSAASNYFGTSLSSAGDMNKDGYNDIIIGAYGWSAAKGAAYVIYGGQKSSMSRSTTTLNPLTNGFMIKGPGNGARFGYAVGTAGDINNDGYKDIIIGAYTYGNIGVAYVIHTACSPCWDCLTNCNECDTSSTSCTECDNLYYLYQSGCLSNCPDTTFASTTTCEPCSTNCNKCTSDTLCTECLSPHLLYQSGCIDSCPDTTFPSSGKCEKCSTNCNQCNSATECIECISPSLLYQSGCLSTCPATTFPASGKCESCSPNCNHCSDSTSTSCTECISPYLLYQSQCLATCPDTTFASTDKCEDCSDNCNKCTSETLCMECLSPYLLYQSECVDSCPPTTYASTGTCEGSFSTLQSESNFPPSKGCSTNCNQCNSATECTECISPYLLYQSECISTCPIKTIASAGKCQECPINCYACSSPIVCEVCSTGYTLSGATCVSLSYQQAQEKASQAISSATQVVGGIVCVGSVTFPVTALVSTIVQNTRYLNLSVTTDLSEIYKTWNTDLISWDVPNVISDFDDFKTSPPLFSRYDLGSSFLNNFWPTLVNIGIGLATFITCSVLKKLFELSEYNKGWIYSLLQKLVMGSFNFTLIQAYACMDNILFYLVIDIKTNPFNSFFSWASLISASVFLALGCLLVFFNFWTVKKYQRIKNQNMKDLDAFNEKNKYWELFYSDFNDDDSLGQSFFAFLIMRSVLSSFIVTVLYDYPLMQTSYLIILDVTIIGFLFVKNPFTALRGTLCQYYFEIITLLVHICTFLLAFQDTLRISSDTLRTVLSTGIIYLNTALVSGSIGFMFIEIYKTISEKRRARKLEKISVPEENHETQNLTTSPLQEVETAPKRQNWLNAEQETSPENFHFLSGIHPNPQRINMEPSSELPFESHLISDNSAFSDVNTSQMMNEPRAINAQPIVLRRRRQIMQHQRRNESVMANNIFNHREQFEDL